MASISLPQSQAGFLPHFDTSNQSPPNTDRRHMHAPLPNPPFVFPAHDSDTPDSQSETVEHRERPALPAFSFNPGAEQQSSHLSAPSLSNPRAGGHRRRPSEFVGNDHLVTPETLGPGHNRASSMIDQTIPPPGPGVGRVPGRRNHAHRRSAAISGVDLNTITKALGPNSGTGSAPCTPADPNRKSVIDVSARPVSQSAMSIGRPTPPASPQFPAFVPPVPPIPAAIQEKMALNSQTSTVERPMPDVSHGSSESTITIKFQPSVGKPDISAPLTPRPDYKPKPRPKTADASLVMDFMQMQNDDSASIKRSHSAAGHSRSRKSKSTPHLESTLLPGDMQTTDTTRPSFSETDTSGDEATGSTSDNKSPLKSKKKKQKRVRSWAGHILTRTKSKGKGKRPAKADTEEETPVPRVSAPRPPALTRTSSGIGSVLDVDFDNDDVVVIRTPTNPAMPPAALEPIGTDKQDDGACPQSGQSLESSWKPRSFYEQDLGSNANMLSSPIIDLDAALGPFNTPDMRPVTQGAHNKNFSVATQRMYSGGRRGEFVGPEMRYHRRTESAPVMQPFDRSALGAFRLGPTSAVETPDVFDEEEEDAFLAATQSPKTELPSSSTADPVFSSSEDDAKSAHSSDSADTGDTLTRPTARSISSQHTGLGIQQVGGQLISQQQPGMSAAEQVQTASNPFVKKPRSPVEILKTEEPAHHPIGPPSPDVSPRFLAVDKRPATSPVELLPSIPPFTLHPGVSPSDSSFPSPDTSRSIAASSMTDQNFSSHSYHQLPCSEYPYASVEDVPSLTSSASTMTNTLNRFSAASFFPRGRGSTDRAASFSAAGTRRTSQANAAKRSSLASLSKLVGGPHAERSKLNQEEKPPGDTSEHTKKKGHRLSRMMHFWKVKDKEKSSTEEASANERPQS
ncbi:uncharacterized protein N7515_004714 [Penicillium bovifimosum]|uniref:Cell wall proline rich protein n=1 Tax=Penicillium bovifimosum TaxID=126998 RepID=A0A9W9L3R1_9EURO|nr:uncharacterized protein N7515_004714 [Penicillium bovifimosum]KAJ5135436.1 hypothetical protein N7515_004714 [Penicillium bovifimosum]